MSVQTEDALKEVGKTAALVEDGSPLQLGASGAIDGKTFTIVGRIQYQFGQGFWNEWYLNMAQEKAELGFVKGQGGTKADRSTGGAGSVWLGEANGIYFFTHLKKNVKLPQGLQFAKLHAGNSVSIDGQTFYIKDIQSSKVVSGEGELPFAFETAYEAPVVDLVSQSGVFATLDFSEVDLAAANQTPLVFIGKSLGYHDLYMNRVRSVYGFKGDDAVAEPSPKAATP